MAEITVAGFRCGAPVSVSIERESTPVWLDHPEPDPAWDFTDAERHRHYYANGYPTLTRVVDETYWCGSCNDEHEESHLECRWCGEGIEPAARAPRNPSFIDGVTSWTAECRRPEGFHGLRSDPIPVLIETDDGRYAAEALITGFSEGGGAWPTMTLVGTSELKPV